MAIPSARAIAYAAAIKQVKYAVAGYAEQIFTKAKIARRYIFDRDLNRWAGLLRSDKDIDPANGKQLVNCVCVFYDGLDLADPEFAVILKSMRPVIPIGLAYYRGFALGTDEDNVEDQLISDIALLQFTLAENKELGLNGIHNHSGIRVPKLDFIPLGDTQVFIGQSRIRVHMDSRQTVGP